MGAIKPRNFHYSPIHRRNAEKTFSPFLPRIFTEFHRNIKTFSIIRSKYIRDIPPAPSAFECDSANAGRGLFRGKCLGCSAIQYFLPLVPFPQFFAMSRKV